MARQLKTIDEAMEEIARLRRDQQALSSRILVFVIIMLGPCIWMPKLIILPFYGVCLLAFFWWSAWVDIRKIRTEWNIS